MTSTPRWIADAAASVDLPDDVVADLATALVERLPLEAITLAAVMNPPEARCAAIVAALADDATETVRRVDLIRAIRDVERALVEAGVPHDDPPGESGHPVDLAGRVRWLGRMRDVKETDREREAREAHRWAGEAREARRVLDELTRALGHIGAPGASLVRRAAFLRDQLADARQQRAAVDRALVDAGQPMDELLTEQGVARLHRELVATRRQRDGAADDLHRERCAHQEAAGEAAARELRLTEERDAARARVAELEHRTGGGS